MTNQRGARRSVTMADIARHGGVSRSTVWAVLNGKSHVRPRTRQKVLAAVRETNYQHRLVAGSLLGHFSQMIGVVVMSLQNPFYTEVVNGLQETLRPRDYFLVTHNTRGSIEDEALALRRLMEYELGGFVLAAVQSDGPHDHIREALEARKPLVTLGPVPGLETHFVDYEDRKGSREATAYLIKKGHRRIVCVAGWTASTSANERILGFVEGLLEHGIEFSERMVVRAGGLTEEGYRAALDLLRDADRRPTALLCFNDLVAMGAYQAAHELGLHIPDDVSVIGFDDIAMAALVGPPLTTMSISPNRVGRTAAEILLTLLKGESDRKWIERKIDVNLVERSSVRAI